MAVSDRQSCTKAQQQVVFVGGFDPRGARYYQQLMVQQAQQQQAVDGAVYGIGRRRAWHADGSGRHSSWSVQSENGAATDYVFYEWSDVVRQHWPRQLWQVLCSACVSYARFARQHADVRQVYQQKPYTVWTLLYPLLYWLMVVVAALGLAAGLVLCWPTAPGALLALLLGGGMLRAGAWLDNRLHVSWLLRIFNFAQHFTQAAHDPLQARHAQMAQALAQQLQTQPALQITVIGFSVGSVMSMGLLQALCPLLTPAQCQRLRWITLGNCIPLFSLLPQAHALRAQLQSLASHPQLWWSDISSPSDSVSFGMCDLMRLALGRHAQPSPRYSGPQHMCTPRFHTLFTPERYRSLCRNKMRMHFQYLMAAQLPGAYDYLALITHEQGTREFVLKRLVR